MPELDTGKGPRAPDKSVGPATGHNDLVAESLYANRTIPAPAVETSKKFAVGSKASPLESTLDILNAREEAAQLLPGIVSFFQEKLPGATLKLDFSIYDFKDRVTQLVEGLKNGKYYMAHGVSREDYARDPRGVEEKFKLLIYKQGPAFVNGDDLYLDSEHHDLKDKMTRLGIIRHELTHLVLGNLPLQDTVVDGRYPLTRGQRIIVRLNPFHEPYAARMSETFKECAAIAMQYGFLETNTAGESPSHKAMPEHAVLWRTDNLAPKTTIQRLLTSPTSLLVKAYCRVGMTGSTHPVAYNFTRILSEHGCSDLLLDLIKNPFIPGVNPKTPGNLSTGEKFKLTWKEFCIPRLYLKRLGRLN